VSCILKPLEEEDKEELNIICQNTEMDKEKATLEGTTGMVFFSPWFHDGNMNHHAFVSTL
jgi:hypothetical protein